MQPIQRRMARPRREIDTNTYSGRFAARLRALRDKAGLSVPELSELSGMPESTLKNWECGRRSAIHEEFPALAEALGVKTRVLFPEK